MVKYDITNLNILISFFFSLMEWFWKTGAGYSVNLLLCDVIKCVPIIQIVFLRATDISHGPLLICFHRVTSEEQWWRASRAQQAHIFDPPTHDYSCVTSLICQEAYKTLLSVRVFFIKPWQAQRDLGLVQSRPWDGDLDVISRSSSPALHFWLVAAVPVCLTWTVWQISIT